MKLYSYWRSTTSYRVRTALNLKGIAYETIPVNLISDEQNQPAYAALNPNRSVPMLVTDDDTVLIQSMAILDWLEETYPDPPFLPIDKADRARVRAAALGIATDIHPVNNLRIVARLKSMGHDQQEAVDWMKHWMDQGFIAFSHLIDNDTPFSFGQRPGLADICLVPQLYNARRWGLDLTPYRRLADIEARCLALPSFKDAEPENQPDAT